MTNKKEHKILRKTLSLTLAMLVSILGIPLAKPQQVSATETSGAKYLSSITMDATASSSWDTNYDTKLYATLTSSGYDSSYTTEATALQISSATQLAAFAKAVNVDGKTFEGKYVKLTKDIDLGGTNPTVTKKVDESDSSKFNISITGTASNVWVPIGTDDNRFKGTFDGGNFEISNMTALVNGTDTYAYAGLFGYVDGGSIKNTGVTGDVYVSSSSSYVYAGGLVAQNGGSVSGGSATISNSYATGNVYAYAVASRSSSYAGTSACVYAGGLAGYSNKGSISSSYATGNVYASSPSSSSSAYPVMHAGGLVGSIYSCSITDGYATGNVCASATSSSTKVYVGRLLGKNDGTDNITNSYYYSGATIDGGTGAIISEDGTGLTMNQMTGTGSDRATEKMEGFVDSNNWDFNDDGIGVKYLPRLKVITYNETTNPVPKFDAPTAEYFGFKAPANLTYDGSAKEATVTSKISEIPNDKITVKYYNSAGTNLTSAPTNAGTYTVKIDVAACDKYEAQTDITADEWTFTIAKADPTIGSTSTTAAYRPGLTLGSVLPPSISGTEGSWTWLKSTAPISSAGAHYFEAKFKPTNTNYNEVTKCILVTVSKATLQASDFNFAAPSNLEYSADYKTATITRKPGIEGIGEPTIKYFTKVNGELTPLGDSSLPTDVGTYYVGIDVGDDINYNSVSGLTSNNWNFTITPAGLHTYQLSNGSRVYLVQSNSKN